MNTPQASHPRAVGYRPVLTPMRQTLQETRADGTLILRSANPLTPISERSFVDFIPKWAELRPNQAVLCERTPEGPWRSITWAQLWQQVQATAAGLLEHGLNAQRPIMALSGNSIEQAILFLAAEYVGIPVAPVSPAYSTLSVDFTRLKTIRDLVQPAALFLQNASAVTRALDALELPQAIIWAVNNAQGAQMPWSQLAATALTPERRAAIAAAHAAIQPTDTARILFTSGSTGVPKGVVANYANLHAVATYIADNFSELTDPPVFLDWLPWHHGLGGILNFGRSIVTGATHYIDDGRPLPSLIDRTVRNLREISPTIVTNVPSAWAMLATEMERDPELARSLFARAIFFGYGGASLPRDVWERIQRVAEKTIGQRIAFCSGLAATETAGLGVFCGWPTDDVGNIGVPMPGSEVKLLPLEGSSDGRYEIRIRGAHNTPGYLRQPELTAAAFDEEGFFRLGDAVLLTNPQDATQGLRFAGRLVEDFKLTNGTWVRTGAVRLGLVERCAPLIADAVICGHDYEYVAALAWPNVVACQRLAPELAQLDAEALIRHPLVLNAMRERLCAQTNAASLSVHRLMLMAEPPSIDANEIADKGYVNQAATRTRRAHLVKELYAAAPSAHVICV